MKSMKVKNFMVQLADYALVSADATLYEAVMALEEAQKQTDGRPDRFRAILVLDENNRLVGKLNMWDVLKGIEPKYRELGYPREMEPPNGGISFLKSMLDTYGLWRKPMGELCSKASGLSVRDIMHVPGEEEYIDEDASLDVAIHQLVMGSHQSLLVTRNDDIVGILRLTDVFRSVCDGIRACRS